MDEAVIKYYRRMLRGTFAHTGSLPNPSIFLDSIGEHIRICGQITSNYLHLYINIADSRVERSNICVLCARIPLANVAIDILCVLMTGKDLDVLEALTEECFLPVLGGGSTELCKRAKGLLELLHRGIMRYRAEKN